MLLSYSNSSLKSILMPEVWLSHCDLGYALM